MKPDIACYNHPDSEGFFQCRYCGRNFCERCSRQVEEGFSVCTAPECLKAYETEAAGPKKPCPHCGYENSPIAFNCGICGKKLSTAPEKHPDSPVVLAKFANLADANLAKAKLENLGIESFVMDEAVGTLYASNSFLGGIRLLTRAGESEKAKEILGLTPPQSEDFYPQGQITGICRYCRETLDPFELKEEVGILHCLKPQCLDAFQKEVKSLITFCPSCGAEAPYPIFYCTNCGKKLKNTPPHFEPEWVAVPKLPDAQKPHTPYEGFAGACRYCGEIIIKGELSSDPGPVHCGKPACLKAYKTEMESLTRACPSCGAKIPYPELICANCGKKLPEIKLDLEPGDLSVSQVPSGEMWDFRWAVLFWLALFSIELVPSIVFSWLHFRRGVLPDRVWVETTFSFSELACITLVVFWTRSFQSLSWMDSLRFLGFKFLNFRQLLAGALILIPILVGAFCGLQGYQQEGVLIHLRSDWGTRLTSILMGAGFFEEILYRGFLFQFLRRGRSFASAAVISSGLWALSHVTHLMPLFGPEHSHFEHFPKVMLQVFADGLLGAYLFEKGGNNIWGWMLVHVGYDSTYLMNTSGGDFYVSDLPENYFDIGHWLSVLLTVPIILWILPSEKKSEEGESAKEIRPAFFQGNEKSLQWKPYLRSLVLAAMTVLVFCLATAQPLSEQANDNDWQKIISSHPRYADGYRKWAYHLWCLEKDDEAMEKCRLALGINPKNFEAWLLWGKILKYKYKYWDAAEKFQKAAEVSPRKTSVYLWWGYILESCNQKNDAIEKYRKALSLNPDETYFTDFATSRIDKLEARRKK